MNGTTMKKKDKLKYKKGILNRNRKAYLPIVFLQTYYYYYYYYYSPHYDCSGILFL